MIHGSYDARSWKFVAKISHKDDKWLLQNFPALAGPMSNPTLCDRWFLPGKSQWSGGPPQLGGCLDRRRRRQLATFAVNQICSFLPTTLSAGRYQEAEEKFLQAWELQKKASKAMAAWWLFDDTCYIWIICASCLVAAAQVNYATMFGLATVLTEQGSFGGNWIHSKSCLECSCQVTVQQIRLSFFVVIRESVQESRSTCLTVLSIVSTMRMKCLPHFL